MIIFYWELTREFDLLISSCVEILIVIEVRIRLLNPIISSETRIGNICVTLGKERGNFSIEIQKKDINKSRKRKKICWHEFTSAAHLFIV